MHRTPAIRDDDKLVAAARAFEYVGDDALRILAARVVRSDDHPVRESRRKASHLRTLPAVALAAAAEEAGKPRLVIGDW